MTRISFERLTDVRQPCELIHDTDIGQDCSVLLIGTITVPIAMLFCVYLKLFNNENVNCSKGRPFKLSRPRTFSR